MSVLRWLAHGRIRRIRHHIRQSVVVILGIHLDEWESRIIETEKGVVRLGPVTERGMELFGESGADILADEIETNAAASAQLSLFPDEPPAVRGSSRRRRLLGLAGGNLDAPMEATTLDRVHAAMLFQASGRTETLRNLLQAEQERWLDFLRLANALCVLYPKDSEESGCWTECCWRRLDRWTVYPRIDTKECEGFLGCPVDILLSREPAA